MRNEGLGSWPARRARKTPHRTALIHDGTAVTYAELHARSTRLAHALRTLGVRRGDRVAYLGPNHPSYLETLFAAGILGAAFVPLNTRLAAPEIAYQLADSGARALVFDPRHTALVETPPGETGVPARIALGDPYANLLAAAPVTPIDEAVGLDELCLIMYTSGTTGRAKGAMLTHANLTWNAVNVLVDHDLVADDIALVAAPLFHTAGLNMLTLPVLLKGGTCVLVESFDPAHTFEAVEERRITFMFGVPTMFDRLTRHPGWDAADLSSLRLLTCGGSPVPTSLIAAYQARGLTFLQGYGMTETSPGALFLDAEHAVSKAGSAGVPHFFSDARVVRPDHSAVDVGETGEVLVRGPHVMSGYWGLPDETAAVFADGWLRTGDVARIDDDGYVTIVDRLKDMIISGGENIYPAEIEDALLAHPGVAECAVIGVPDPDWGEVGRAVLVARDDMRLDPAEVLGGLAGRLAKYKIPKSAVVVDELPRTASGKVLKHQVRGRYGASRTTLPSTSGDNTMTTTVDGLDALKELAGADLGTSEWIDVTQDRVNRFADATGDHQWIHVDAEKAKQGPFGGPIAHGYLTLSLFVPMFTELLDVQGVTTKVNYGLNRVRFPAPVPVGSRLRLTATLTSVEDAGGGVQITVDGTVEIEGGTKPACVLQSVSRFYA